MSRILMIGGTPLVAVGSKSEGGARYNIVATNAVVGPKLGKGLIRSSSTKVGGVRGCKVAYVSGSTCSKTGKEACELQRIIKEY